MTQAGTGRRSIFITGGASGIGRAVARLFAERLHADPRLGDFRVVASHQESLHSHDAVSVLTEGATFAQASLDPHLFASLIHRG